MIRREQGFTLTEMLVAMSLFGVLAAAGSLLLSSSIRHSSEVQERVLLQTEVRGAVEGVVRDLRQAYTGDDTSALESIGPSEITFLSPDRAEPFHLRRISYRVTGDELQRAIAVSTNTDGPPWVIPALENWTTQAARLVEPNVFTYQDETGAATADPAAVRTVVITVVAATRTAPDRRLTYQTVVHLRATR